MSPVTASDIRDILSRLSISQSEFARRTHVHRSYVTQLLNGARTNPSKLYAEQVAKICRENSLDDIAERIEQRIEK